MCCFSGCIQVCIPMHSNYQFNLRLCLVLILSLWSANCWAAPQSSDNFNLAVILNAFESQILAMKHPIYLLSKNLIFYLGVFAITFRGIYLILQQGTIISFTIEMVKLIFLFGLIRFFLLNGYDFASDIINSLLLITSKDSSSFKPSTESLNEFFEFVSDFAQTMAPNNALFFMTFMVLMYGALCFLFILYMIRYLSVIFILVFGSVSIVFAVFRPTRYILCNFISLSISIALKFVALCFIIRIGQEITKSMISSLRIDVMMGATISLQDAGFVLLVFFLICAAAFYLPILLSNICMPLVSSRSLGNYSTLK